MFVLLLCRPGDVRTKCVVCSNLKKITTKKSKNLWWDKSEGQGH